MPLSTQTEQHQGKWPFSQYHVPPPLRCSLWDVLTEMDSLALILSELWHEGWVGSWEGEWNRGRILAGTEHSTRKGSVEGKLRSWVCEEWEVGLGSGAGARCCPECSKRWMLMWYFGETARSRFPCQLNKLQTNPTGITQTHKWCCFRMCKGPS